jgi:acyl-CoA synthetase (AMP-forming)/AMP-acid ligase II
MQSNQCNIAQDLLSLANKYANIPAIIYKEGRQYKECTFSQFNQLANDYAKGFSDEGIKKGTRVIMLVPHSLNFYLVMFALFKLGAVPVVIDPGMAKVDMLICIKEAEAEAIIGIPFAHFLKAIFKKTFASCKISIIVGRKWFWRGVTLKKIKNNNAKSNNILRETLETDLAAILFTSGSTGIPKGVEYEHGMFYQQVIAIRKLYDLKPGQKDLPCFPLFGLFSLSMGVTLILPDINPSKPAFVKPKKIIEPILKFGITNCFASPAIWNNVCAYCQKNNIKLPTLKIALAAGAPIPGHIIQRLCNGILPADGDVYTPYGATESLPVASIGGRDRLKNTQQKTNEGGGICVGQPIEGVSVKIIGISDDRIPLLENVVVLKNGQIGEIIVNSKTTTKNYFRKPDKTYLAKIQDGAQLWHRMGDVGYLDENNTLWFCGRKDHRVNLNDGETLFTIPCEAIFNQHTKVFRTALVAIKNKNNIVEPILAVELKGDYWKLKDIHLANEILLLGQKFKHTEKIKKCFFHKEFLVDVRHNAKIDREYLSRYAQMNYKTEEELKSRGVNSPSIFLELLP